MENITLGQIETVLVFLVGFLGTCGAMFAYFKKAINKILEPMNKKIINLELASIKTDLVNFINDVECGVSKSQIQKLNAHELYDRYTQLGGNSYVHDHWQNLMKEGKL